MNHDHEIDPRLSRRAFMRGAAGLTAAAIGAPAVFGAPSQPGAALRIGVVGCGGRGKHDVGKLLEALPGARLTAMGDLFQDRLDDAFADLSGRFASQVDVPSARRFIGMQSYGEVLASDIDAVVFTTPPYFRPTEFRAAVEAGRHVFLEKPLAVDPVGLRSVLETAQLADSRNIKVLVGTQMRRITHLVEGMARLHEGAIGEIKSGTVIRISSGLTNWGLQQREPGSSDIEWQIRRWLFINWLAGDFIVEQSIHNLDLMDWAMNANAERSFGTGGRQSRTGELFGNVFDHMSVEYGYANDARIQYHGAQIDGISSRMDIRLVGTRGTAFFDFGRFRIEGENPWEFDGQLNDPMHAQFQALEQAIRRDEPLNDAHRIAQTTLTAIMGRMSAYTGRAISRGWALNESKLRLGPASLDQGSYELPPPAQPGITELI